MEQSSLCLHVCCIGIEPYVGLKCTFACNNPCCVFGTQTRQRIPLIAWVHTQHTSVLTSSDLTMVTRRADFLFAPQRPVLNCRSQCITKMLGMPPVTVDIDVHANKLIHVQSGAEKLDHCSRSFSYIVSGWNFLGFSSTVHLSYKKIPVYFNRDLYTLLVYEILMSQFPFGSVQASCAGVGYRALPNTVPSWQDA